MENTNQKNTGNIQIAPVSAASDLNHKREGYLTWDEYFMGVAMLSGMRSKDPNSQVGACIVSDDNKILSMGSQKAVQMMNFLGQERESLWIPNICM